MKLKNKLILLGILMGVINCFGFNNSQATEITSVFSGETITRDTVQTVSLTSELNTDLVLGISKVRENEEWYAWNPKTDAIDSKGNLIVDEYGNVQAQKVWKIAKYSSESSDVRDYSNLYYCLNVERGFGFTDGEMAEGAKDIYPDSYDMKDTTNKTTITNLTGGSLGINYNKVLWILDNSYIPTGNTNYQETSEYKKLMNLANINIDGEDERLNLTENDIEVVQQMAIWYFTNQNNSNFNQNKLPSLYLNGTQLTQLYFGTDEYGSQITGRYRQDKAEQLYRYFITNASESYTIKTPTLSLSNENVKVTEIENNYIVGPFSLTGTNKELIKNITSNVNIEYTLLNSSKVAVADNDFSKVIGNDFYLKIAKNKITQNRDITISLTYEYEQKELTVLTDANDSTNTQTVVLVQSKENNISINTNAQIKLANVTVFKLWDDNGDQDGKRPQNITVNLLANGTKVKDITLTSSNGWKYTFEKLLKNKDGKTIAYSVTENVVNNYTTSITGDEDNGFVITNTHIPETISISGTKTWDDNEDQDGKRPEEITINLLANDTEIKEVKVTASNDWKYSFTDLPKYSEGELITYTITEDKVNEYETTIDETVNGYDITNKYTPSKVSKTVIKNWEDGNDSDNIRPDSIEVELYKIDKDGQEVTVDKIKLNAKNKWTYTWNNLDEKANGEKIVYGIKEIGSIEGYTTSYSPANNYANTKEIIITNTHVSKDLAIQIEKVDEEGNIITSSETKFEISGAQTLTGETNQGKLDLNSQKLKNNFEYIYTIKEVKAPIGYNLISEELSVKISGTAKSENGSYVIDNVNITDKDGNHLDVSKISAEYNSDLNKVIIKIINTKLSNEYKVRLLKVGEDGTTALDGAVFIVNNGQAIPVPLNGIEIDSGVLNSEHLDNNEIELEYILQEETAPNGYIKIAEPKTVKIKAKVELLNNTYEITQVDLIDELDEIAVIEENNEITIKVKNEPIITGKYNIVLRKVDENGNILPGSEFEMKRVGSEEWKKYSLVDGEVKLFEEDIDLYSTDDIELFYNIKETKVPTGYIGIEETVIQKIAKVEKNGNRYNISEIIKASEEKDNPNITVTKEGNVIVITVKNTPVEKEFDLALRKFITKINDETYSREPVVDTSTIATTKTATYKHSKQPIAVQKGDIVTYTIRVYNEGEIAGYVESITDHLPDNLLPIIAGVDGIDEEKYADEIEINNKWLWMCLDEGNTITTTITSKEKSDLYSENTGITEVTDTKLEAYVEGSDRLDYIDVQIKCLVTDSAVGGEYLTNIAEITDAQDINGVKGDGFDSELNNANYSNLADYKNNEAITSTTESYIQGQEDDDDFEKLVVKEFDLALRKFITKVNETTYSREPIVDTSTIATTKTATYKHSKQPIAVQKGDIVTYTIRVYNEGETDGYVDSITDHLPDHLLPLIIGVDGIDEEKYADEIEINNKWLWMCLDEGNTIITTITSKDNSGIYSELTGLEEVTDTKLEAYVEGSNSLDYIDVQIKCLVTDSAVGGEYLTNIAEITDAQNINGVKGDGFDSELNNANYSNLADYKNNEAINSTTEAYVPGQEDDDDFEKLVVKEFDLALRKFITKVNETTYSREPLVDTSKLGTIVDGKTVTTANYIHTKEPVIVETSDLVTYKIRIYNEGTIAGFATEITDDIPEGLEFLPNSDINVSYRWKMLDKNGEETKDATKAVIIVTDYLSDRDSKNIIRELVEENGEKILSYKEVEVQFKVVAKAEKLQDNLIINEAQISADSDRDIDSTPNRDEKYDYTIGKNEDDIDYEPIKLQYFDLALRKFITKVNNTDYNNRYPEIKFNDDGSITYNHTKDPVLVRNGDTVIYTIRVYNEGEKPGFATEIKDNLPEGLAFDPNNEINKTYGWKMLDKDGNVTEETEKVVAFKTNYLENEKIEALVEKNGLKVLDYKDVQIAFIVTESNKSERILVNTAQISADSDDDIDSTPDNSVEAEDDIDKEYVKVQYFDLALKKWVTATRVTLNGKTTTTKTGFTEDKEGIAKVDIVASKLKKTTVKFVYNIKITNEGKLPGYAYEVKDYIPDGLKFVAEDNKNWKEVKNNVVVTDQLKDTLLNPGESATVEIVLTWKNSSTNLGLKTNYAEISDDSDEDIDSIPDNYDFTEDDIDDAQVILSIKTAGKTTYIGLVLISTAILAGGILLIKKYVLD